MCTDARSADQHLGDTRPGIDVDIQLQLLADEEPVCCPFVWYTYMIASHPRRIGCGHLIYDCSSVNLQPPTHQCISCCSTHRKSRIVGAVEEVHKAVDNHCQARLQQIQAAKERCAYELKQKARCVSHTYTYHVHRRMPASLCISIT